MLSSKYPSILSKINRFTQTDTPPCLEPSLKLACSQILHVRHTPIILKPRDKSKIKLPSPCLSCANGRRGEREIYLWRKPRDKLKIKLPSPCFSCANGRRREREIYLWRGEKQRGAGTGQPHLVRVDCGTVWIAPDNLPIIAGRSVLIVSLIHSCTVKSAAGPIPLLYLSPSISGSCA